MTILRARSLLFIVFFAVCFVLHSVPAQAEFYIWRDAKGVRQISNVPRHCIVDGRIRPSCRPEKARSMTAGERLAMLEKQRHESALRAAETAEAERARTEQAAETEKIQAEQQQKGQEADRQRLQDLRAQLDDAQDEAALEVLQGKLVSRPLKNRMVQLREEIKAVTDAQPGIASSTPASGSNRTYP